MVTCPVCSMKRDEIKAFREEILATCTVQAYNLQLKSAEASAKLRFSPRNLRLHLKLVHKVDADQEEDGAMINEFALTRIDLFPRGE